MNGCDLDREFDESTHDDNRAEWAHEKKVKERATDKRYPHEPLTGAFIPPHLRSQ